MHTHRLADNGRIDGIVDFIVVENGQIGPVHARVFAKLEVTIHGDVVDIDIVHGGSRPRRVGCRVWVGGCGGQGGGEGVAGLEDFFDL